MRWALCYILYWPVNMEKGKKAITFHLQVGTALRHSPGENAALMWLRLCESNAYDKHFSYAFYVL